MDVLIVEDDDAIAEPLARGLEREQFTVRRVATGSDALAADPPDIVLLDLGLPDMDGREVCRVLREQSAVPILVVSARGEEIDRVDLLEMGADDYLVKPFGFQELVARIRAVTRRARGTERRRDPVAAAPRLGALVVDRRAHRVSLGGAEVSLTPKEYQLLALLASDPGRAFTRSEIFEEVWEPDWYGPTKTLDVHVAAVRRKLGDAGWIETVRGVGFRLVDPHA